MDPETTKRSVTIGQLGPWIISALALMQVWVIAFIHKMKKTSVTIHESGNIELVYAALGPTVGLWGTMRAQYKDTFVERFSLSITHMHDLSTHKFDWRFSRPSSIIINSSNPVTFELISSFLLTQNKPLKYNIIFVDEAFISEISPKVGYIYTKWIEFRDQTIKKIKEKELEGKHKSTPFSAIINHPLFNDTLFDAFIKKSDVTDAYTILDRAFYRNFRQIFAKK